MKRNFAAEYFDLVKEITEQLGIQEILRKHLTCIKLDLRLISAP
jgi:hypothetical protein